MKRLIFIGMTPYPNGLASTNRMVTLLNELPKYGWDVEVVCMASTKFPTSFNNGRPRFHRFGTHKSVNYTYTALTVEAASSLFWRAISGIWGIVKMPFIVTKLWYRHKDYKSVCMTSMTQGYYLILIKVVCWMLSLKLVLLRSEYPNVIRNKSILTMPYQKFFEVWIFKLLDGFALMTQSLIDYFKPLSRTNTSFELIPMTVDIHRFSEDFDSPFNFKYIAYAGSLSNEKDGVDILIKSFLRIADHHPNMHLVIIGDTSKSDFYAKLKMIIQNEGLIFQDRIHFTGRIDASLMPQYLTNASILALARPDSKQAQGGFPTKLGEYLATGKPVIVTSVGEIPDYLSHRKNAILCEPGSVSDFTKHLNWILQNEQLQFQIGKAGKEVAHDIFNSIVQGRRFNLFLQQFITN